MAKTWSSGASSPDSAGTRSPQRRSNTASIAATMRTAKTWLDRAETVDNDGNREIALRRGPGAPGHRRRDAGRLVHPRITDRHPRPRRRRRTTARAIAKITRCDLVAIDDIGMLPAGQAAAEALYRLADAAYERRSLIVTSNLHPSGLDTIMPKTLATATVDRLLHHAHLVLTEGSSLRLAEATAGKGVTPLT